MMCEKNVITSNGENLYLATFELVCGEYGQFFEKTFYAKNEGDIEKQIHEYLVDYYGEGNTFEIDGNVYYYWHGEVAVKNHGWIEITELEQLVNRLL
jgi:hypothetical protein